MSLDIGRSSNLLKLPYRDGMTTAMDSGFPNLHLTIDSALANSITAFSSLPTRLLLQLTFAWHTRHLDDNEYFILMAYDNDLTETTCIANLEIPTYTGHAGS